MKKKHAVGYAFALLATAFWSGNFIVARSFSDSIHPFSLSFYRWLVAVIAFSPFAIKYVIKDWKVIKKHFPYLTLTAFLGVSVFNTLIYFAGRSTVAVNMSLIMLTFPIHILIISSIVFKEKIGWLKILGIIVVIFGVLGIVTKGKILSILSIQFNSGDPIMLLTALIFASHSILVKSKPEKLSIVSLQYVTFFLGMVILFPFHLWSKNYSVEVLFSREMIIGILYIGIFSSLVSFVSWNKAIDKIGASTAGLIYYLLPLFSGIAAWIILKEKLQYYHLICGLLIILGIIISNQKFRN
jgi:drug/metabolite transporter (DMT)-like permease